MKKNHFILLSIPIVLVGCSNAAPSFKEGESLEAQGSFEEAAQKFELVCAEAPAGPECQQAGARAATALSSAAAKAMEKGEFSKGQRLFLRALLNADDAGRKDIEARLAKEDLGEGIRYEQAVADKNKLRALKTMEAIASGNTTAAPMAKAWIEKERASLLVMQAKAACGPAREGSCSEAFEKLSALPQPPPGFDEAKAAHDAERKRTEKARAEAERFLPVFAQRGKKREAYEKCMVEKASELEIEQLRVGVCRDEAYADGKTPYERVDAERTEDSLFRKRLADIGDPALIASFEERKKKAIESGEVPGKAGGAK